MSIVIKVTILMVSVLLLISASFANGNLGEAITLKWEKTYGPYYAYSIVQTFEGGFAIAAQNATYEPFSPHNPPNWVNFTALLIKTDSSGNVSWEKNYQPQIASSVVQTNDSGFVICGDNSLLKLDPQGNVQWNRTFTGLKNCQAIQTADGGFVVFGNTPANDIQTISSFLIRTDNSGQTLWANNFTSDSPTGNEVFIESVQQTSNNGFVLAGSWGGVFWFAKTDASGNLELNLTYPAMLDFQGGFNSIAKTTDGGYVLAGSDYNPTKQTSYSGWVVKTDDNGIIQWSYHFQLPGFGAMLQSVAQTTDGGYVVVGNPALIKLDSAGKLVWNVTGYNANFVIPLKNGGFVVAGGQGDLTSSSQQLWIAEFGPETNGVPSSSVPELSTWTVSASPSANNPSPAVPEFPSWAVLPFLIIAVSIAGVYLRRKLKPH